MLKINVGCGMFPRDGYTNIDLRPPADIVGDFTTMAFENVTEVAMTHILEHFPWRRTVSVLAHVRGWCDIGALLTVEVPDMVEILAQGTTAPGWQQNIYGEQSHPGECHLSGFTTRSLSAALIAAGFDVDGSRTFLSDHPGRVGYPCLEVTGRAGV